MTNTLGNQSKRRKTKYDTRSAESLKQKIMSVKPIPKKKEKTVENKVESTGELMFVKDPGMYLGFQEYLNEKFPNEQNLFTERLEYESIMKGSNPLIAIAMDMYLKEQYPQYRIATQADLEINNENQEFVKDTIQDVGLVLRDFQALGKLSDNSRELYESLEAVYKRRKGDFTAKLELPLFVNLKGLYLADDVIIRATEEASWKSDGCLTWSNISRFDKTDEFGLPLRKTNNLTIKRLFQKKDNNLYVAKNETEGILNFSRDPLYESFDASRIVLTKVNKDFFKESQRGSQ
jgi:hypothetical protein